MQDVKDENTDAKQEQVTASATPSVDAQTPSVEGTQPAMYTEEQVNQKVNEKHSALDKQIAEQRKWLNLAQLNTDELAATKAKLAELEKIPDSALTSAEGVDFAKERAKLHEKEVALQAKLDAANWDWLARQEVIEASEKATKEQKLAEIATEFKVPLDKLKDLPSDSIEQVRQNARVIASLQLPAEQIPVDSGINTVGAGANWEETKALYAAGKLSHESYIKARANQPF